MFTSIWSLLVAGLFAKHDKARGDVVHSKYYGIFYVSNVSSHIDPARSAARCVIHKVTAQHLLYNKIFKVYL